MFFAWRRPLIGWIRARAGLAALPPPPPASVPDPLPAGTFRVMLWTLLLSFVAASQILLFPLSTPRVVGSAALAGFALASINIFGSFVLTLLPLRFDLPVLAPWVLGVSLVFSAFNDNHFSESDGANWKGPRPDVKAAFKAWHDAHPDERDVYVVATEGGGIRAAYWTAALLQGLDSRDDFRLRERLFAISSVSGGSIGAGVWLATVRPKICSKGTTRPPKADVDLPKDAATRILSTDFLSPIIGYLFYPDLMQQFLPFPVKRFDRSHALEDGLIRATSRVEDQPLRLSAAGFYDHCPELPILLLNSTVSETGQRAILTQLDTSAFDQAYPLRAATAAGAAASHVIDPSTDHQPMAGLMHHSARFPVASPAGTLTDYVDSIHWMTRRPPVAHLVDGGYFDNSGIVTALETIRQASESPAAQGLRFHLFIFDDVAYAECGSQADGACETTKAVVDPPGAHALLHEIAPIFGGLYNVRDAHVHETMAGALLAAASSAPIDVRQVFRHPVPDKASRERPVAAAASSPAASEAEVQAPLGWALSREVINGMNDDARRRVSALKLGVVAGTEMQVQR
jgi:hypothetical protein